MRRRCGDEQRGSTCEYVASSEPIDPNRVYSPDDAAGILGVSRDQISVLIRDRVLLETTSRDGTWGLSGYSLFTEQRFRRTAPRWRRIARRLWHDLPF